MSRRFYCPLYLKTLIEISGTTSSVCRIGQLAKKTERTIALHCRCLGPVPINMLEQFLTTRYENRLIIMMNSQSWNERKCSCKNISNKYSAGFCEKQITNIRIPEKLMSIHGPQFIYNFSQEIWNGKYVNMVSFTEYYRSADG